MPWWKHDLFEQPRLGLLPAKIVVRLNATISADMTNRDALPLQRGRDQQAAVTSLWIFFCAENRGGSLVRQVDEPLDARLKIGSLRPARVVDMAVLVVVRLALGSTAELLTEKHVREPFGSQ